MNVEHIPAEDVDMLPCGADWQSRHLESEKRKAEIRDRIHKQAEQGQKTAKDYFRPAKPTPSIYDSDLKRVAVYQANITLRQYQRLESGERNILTSSFGLACRVIEALDMDVSKFYHGDYYLEELKTIEGKRFGDRGKHQFK